jgi:hypothetical protein
LKSNPVFSGCIFERRFKKYETSSNKHCIIKALFRIQPTYLIHVPKIIYKKPSALFYILQRIYSINNTTDRGLTFLFVWKEKHFWLQGSLDSKQKRPSNLIVILSKIRSVNSILIILLFGYLFCYFLASWLQMFIYTPINSAEKKIKKYSENYFLFLLS